MNRDEVDAGFVAVELQLWGKGCRKAFGVLGVIP